MAGAIQAIAVDPNDPQTIYIGTVNGGVWRTTNGVLSSNYLEMWRVIQHALQVIIRLPITATSRIYCKECLKHTGHKTSH